MKKTIILAAFAALVLGACTKVETIETKAPEAVTFGVYVPKATQTKVGGEAGSQTTISLGKTAGPGFGVFAFYSDNSTGGAANDYNPSSSNFIPNFMWNQQVKGNGNGTDAAATAWTYSPVKYWPNEYNSSVTGQGIDKLTFFAYAPWVNADKSTGNVGSETEGITHVSSNALTPAGDPTLTYVMPSDVANLVDVLYADAASLKNLTKPAGNTAVSFPFKHALTSVVFRVQTFIDGVNSTSDLADTGAAVDGATVVTLNEIYFGGTSIVPSGTLNIATGVWTPDEATSKTYSKTSLAHNVTATKTDVTGMDPIMLIPNGAPTNYDVRVVYSVVTTDEKLSTGNSTVNNDIKNTINLTLQAGKKNIVDLVLGLYTVKVSASVTPWVDATAVEVDLPQNN